MKKILSTPIMLIFPFLFFIFFVQVKEVWSGCCEEKDGLCFYKDEIRCKKIEGSIYHKDLFCYNYRCVLPITPITSIPTSTLPRTSSPTSTPTSNPSRICTPEQTVCVSTNECVSGCKACTKDGTRWYCTDSSWCNWCLSKPTATPIRRSPTVTPTKGLISPSPSCPATKIKGDANCDGKIDGIDYSIWLNRQCTSGCSNSNLVADFNGDRKVDDDDYFVWFNNRQ